MSSRTVKKGKKFLAYGSGNFGPFAVATYRIAPKQYLKASIGAKGLRVGVMQRGKKCNYEAYLNTLTGNPGFRIKRRK